MRRQFLRSLATALKGGFLASDYVGGAVGEHLLMPSQTLRAEETALMKRADSLTDHDLFLGQQNANADAEIRANWKDIVSGSLSTREWARLKETQREERILKKAEKK